MLCGGRTLRYQCSLENTLLLVRNLTGYLFAAARNEALRFIKSRHRYHEVVEDLRNVAILESATVDAPSLEEV